jgi:hypothetical protein
MLGPNQEVVVVYLSQVDFDHEREVAYRRGYLRGASAAISGVAHGLTLGEREAVERWLENKLTTWARSSKPSCMSAPPEFPKATDNA